MDKIYHEFEIVVAMPEPTYIIRIHLVCRISFVHWVIHSSCFSLFSTMWTWNHFSLFSEICMKICQPDMSLTVSVCIMCYCDSFHNTFYHGLYTIENFQYFNFFIDIDIPHRCPLIYTCSDKSVLQTIFIKF